jgi:hypothetical protein
MRVSSRWRDDASPASSQVPARLPGRSVSVRIVVAAGGPPGQSSAGRSTRARGGPTIAVGIEPTPPDQRTDLYGRVAGRDTGHAPAR